MRKKARDLGDAGAHRLEELRLVRLHVEQVELPVRARDERRPVGLGCQEAALGTVALFRRQRGLSVLQVHRRDAAGGEEIEAELLRAQVAADRPCGVRDRRQAQRQAGHDVLTLVPDLRRGVPFAADLPAGDRAAYAGDLDRRRGQVDELDASRQAHAVARCDDADVVALPVERHLTGEHPVVEAAAGAVRVGQEAGERQVDRAGLRRPLDLRRALRDQVGPAHDRRPDRRHAHRPCRRRR
jgi:hypothetical protein